MNEMRMLSRLRAGMPDRPVPTRARDLLGGAIDREGRKSRLSHEEDPATVTVLRAPRPASPRPSGLRPHADGRRDRGWRPALAGVATLALLATAVAAGQELWRSPEPGPTAAQVTEQAAAAARARPAVRPDQWLQVKKKVVGCQTSALVSAWWTADAGNWAEVSGGKIQSTLQARSHGAGAQGSDQSSQTLIMVPNSPICRHQPVVLVQSGQGGGTVTISGPSNEQMAVAMAGVPTFTYAGLGKLPRDAGALARHLSRLPLRPTGLGRGAYQAFYLTYALLSSYVPPPRLTAELYSVLGDIPGVTVAEHAADAAGRAGVALRLPLRRGSALTQEIILAPHMGRLLGYELTKNGRLISGIAILRRALVPRP